VLALSFMSLMPESSAISLAMSRKYFEPRSSTILNSRWAVWLMILLILSSAFSSTPGISMLMSAPLCVMPVSFRPSPSILFDMVRMACS
jgi:hypothetical protein